MGNLGIPFRSPKADRVLGLVSFGEASSMVAGRVSFGFSSKVLPGRPEHGSCVRVPSSLGAPFLENLAPGQGGHDTFLSFKGRSFSGWGNTSKIQQVDEFL